MAIPHDVAMAIWYRALEAEIGIAVETTHAEMMRTELYAARKAEADPELEKLMITIMAIGNEKEEVWLIKKETEL